MPSTFNVFKTWSAGDILTASDLNSSFTQFTNNLDPSGLGPTGTTLAAWRNTSNPYPNNTEALPASLLVELQQMKYMLTVLNGQNYWYQSPGYISAGLVAASSLYDNVSQYRKLSKTSSPNAIPLYSSAGDLLDRNSNPIWATGVPNANATSTISTTSITGIAVTNGDILFVQSQILWTNGVTAESVGPALTATGVTSTWMNGNPGNATYGNAILIPGANGYNFQLALFGILYITQTGTLSVNSILHATSPTAITNLIGYGFLKKQ